MSSVSRCVALPRRGGQSGVWRKMQLVVICSLLLLASLTGTQGQGLTHRINNRNSNIDPSWYVGRGVRPIGRFGKRQMVAGGSDGAAGSLAQILTALRERNTDNSEQLPVGGGLY